MSWLWLWLASVEVPLNQSAKDFGISDSSLQRWVKPAEVNGVPRPGISSNETALNRFVRNRVKQLEQQVEVMRPEKTYLSQTNRHDSQQR